MVKPPIRRDLYSAQENTVATGAKRFVESGAPAGGTAHIVLILI